MSIWKLCNSTTFLSFGQYHSDCCWSSVILLSLNICILLLHNLPGFIILSIPLIILLHEMI
ncbi:hypothetical protein DERP_002411 [Dermatophagoides pteronyssinus]|uniref:Uncharacterized protein n=1 Tax=Dermatophagoides pteronyssinus TaxID=6956 RepID=A0ABQ8JI14_DERPT|nr:hypothetical protein DERP_002411 [Dermatophagoides pteronyssinus]